MHESALIQPIMLLVGRLFTDLGTGQLAHIAPFGLENLPLFLPAFFQTLGMADAYNTQHKNTMKRIYLQSGHGTLSAWSSYIMHAYPTTMSSRPQPR